MIIKATVSNINYYCENYDPKTQVPIKNIPHNINVEIVYWYKSNDNDDYLTPAEATLLTNFMNTHPDIFSNIVNLEDDAIVEWDNTVCAIPLNSFNFIVEIINYNLPFNSKGRRRLIQ